MPSLRDLTGRLDDDIEVIPDGGSAPADVLERVKVDGLRRRHRRHRRNTVLAGLALAVVAVPAIALLPSDDSPEDVRVASESDSNEDSAPDSPPTTEDATGDVDQAGDIATTVPVVVTTAVPPPVTEPGVELGPAVTYEREQPTPTTAPPPPPTTAPPPPPNQPLTASFTSPTEVAAGDVTFVVQWSDPDAIVTYFDFAVGDEPLLAQPCTAERGGESAQPSGGSGEITETRTLAPGEYVVTVYLATADCNSPYHSEATEAATITVT